MGRFKGSVRYRSKPAAPPVDTTPVARITARPCAVTGCKGRLERADYAFCDAHYAAVPFRLKTALVQNRRAKAEMRSVAFIAALNYLEANESQLSTGLFGEGDANA